MEVIFVAVLVIVSTLFSHNRTHYLNILHASWPAGLVLGGLAGAYLGEELKWGWKEQLALFLVPTVVYGLMFLGQRFPKSEASAKGLKLGDLMQPIRVALTGTTVSEPVNELLATVGAKASLARLRAVIVRHD